MHALDNYALDLVREPAAEHQFDRPGKRLTGIRQHAGTVLLAAVLHGLSASTVAAQVPTNGFTVRHEALIAAHPAAVYRSLVEQVAEWWNPQHTYSGDSRNLSIEARPGGCFCERLPNGGGVEHLRVVYLVPGEVIRFSGGLGPLQASGVAGSMTWTVTTADGATVVEVTYVVGGFLESGFDRVAPPVSAVIGEQLQRLKRFVETGTPATR